MGKFLILMGLTLAYILKPSKRGSREAYRPNRNDHGRMAPNKTPRILQRKPSGWTKSKRYTTKTPKGGFVPSAKDDGAEKNIHGFGGGSSRGGGAGRK